MSWFSFSIPDEMRCRSAEGMALGAALELRDASGATAAPSVRRLFGEVECVS